MKYVHNKSPCMYMGKNNNGLAYHRLIINTTTYTVFVNHSAVFLCSTIDIYGRYSTVLVFDPPMQNTISIN